MPQKRPAPRLALLDEAHMNDAQRALLASLRAGPRGKSITPRGPFAAWMHAPDLGQLAQALGAHCRYNKAVPPRLSEFAILCTARLWRAQYEWFAHAPIAEKAGVKPKTIADMRAGREPNRRPRTSERSMPSSRSCTRRAASATAPISACTLLGDSATVELVGILGYYTLIAMTLNVFRMMPPADVKLGFAEPA